MDGDTLVQAGLAALAASDPTEANTFLRERVRDAIIGVIAGLQDAGEAVTIERVVDEVVELLANGDYYRSDGVQRWLTKTLGLKRTITINGTETQVTDVEEIDRRFVILVAQVMVGLTRGQFPEISRVNGVGVTLTDAAMRGTMIPFSP